MSELLLGFDLRIGILENEMNWKSEGRNDQFLLRTNIFVPASVDPRVWPSKFSYEPPQGQVGVCNGTVQVEALSFRQHVFEVWADRDEMVRAYSSSKPEESNRCQVIAISFLPVDASDLGHEWTARLDSPLAEISDLDTIGLTKMGYDVASIDFISGLSNCGFDEDEAKVLRPEWSARINVHGLIDDLGDAFEFKALSDRRVSEHSPFYVFGLYSDYSGPASPMPSEAR